MDRSGVHAIRPASRRPRGDHPDARFRATPSDPTTLLAGVRPGRRPRPLAGRHRVRPRRHDPRREPELPRRRWATRCDEVRRPAPPDVRATPAYAGSRGVRRRSGTRLRARRVRRRRVPAARPRAAARCGCRRRTTRSSTPTASRSRSSSSPATSPRPSCATPSSRARSTRSTGRRRSSSSTSTARILRRQPQLPRPRSATRCDEVRGKHHRMFVDPELRASQRVRRLLGAARRAASSTAGEYQRVGKGGHEVWIQATYNPILDADGRAVQGRQVRHRHHRAPSCATPSSRARSTRSTGPRPSSSSTSRAPSSTPTRTSCARSATRCARSSASTTACSAPTTTSRSAEYRDFWLRLRQGRGHRRPLPPRRQVRPRRLHPGHLQPDPRPARRRRCKVVKYAYDVTEQVEREQRVDSKHPAR